MDLQNDLIGISALMGKQASMQVYGFVDKRKVTFWTIIPLGFNTDHTVVVARELVAAEALIERDTAKVYRGPSPQAFEISNSVQHGIRVGCSQGGKALIVYTDFWKEGEDRSQDEIGAMMDHLVMSGVPFSMMPLSRR